ncbi:glycosyltransferase family 4 protein [Parasediminibacterium paludis]|uniref:Glycosyltransferase family 4 protein n=1 Tax=Parasediminibacterium paludis TaxID=908966 RepID=A0ABV8PVK3_9BACT
MKYPNTGLYHFCLQLGKALIELADPSKEELFFYVQKNAHGIFGNQVKYIHQHSFHKFIMPLSCNFDIWSKTYQGTMYNPRFKRIKSILTIHDINFMYDDKPLFKKRKYLKALQQKIDSASHIIAISNFVLTDISKHCNIDNKSVSVIYNGCNISDEIIAEKPASMPAQPFLYTIGTIAQKKNFHVLPALLVNNNYQLIISGITQSDAYKQQIVDNAKQLGVADRLVFTGAISEAEKYWYYQHCEAFVFPSIAEGFGLPVIEAMHFGKLTILSTHTSLPEVGGPHAYYFPDFEPTTMQQTLFNSLAHYHQQNPQVAIKNWASQFSWQQAAIQYLNIYRTL